MNLSGFGLPCRSPQERKAKQLRRAQGTAPGGAVKGLPATCWPEGTPSVQACSVLAQDGAAERREGLHRESSIEHLALAILASSPDQRFSVRSLRTAMARALRWPMRTTSFLPRVTPV